MSDKEFNPVIYLMTDNTGETEWTTHQDHFTDENNPQTYFHSTLYAEKEARVFELAEKVLNLKRERDALMEIVKAVAHIGVDFGFGVFSLSDDEIAKARELFEQGADKQ